ncbi:hypothetical protein PCASD_07922 [Puccinia coronata f. sp. avenae]|uniref:Secreted protein n=1 Tax=Puccinia coronata f. sp. avenae TaxID=200324 RepID=A0A2N5UQ35_9BASI|nr:hypothetical protein PCASD_07922 [Puccinia coronata f. sp. avenae]
MNLFAGSNMPVLALVALLTWMVKLLDSLPVLLHDGTVGHLPSQMAHQLGPASLPHSQLYLSPELSFSKSLLHRRADHGYGMSSCSWDIYYSGC